LEIFTIDKKSKLRIGEYLKIDTKSSDTLILGTYKDDLKTGIWNYNSKDSKPWISYDYDKKVLSRLSDQISKSDSFSIRKNDTFISEKVDSPPLYIGYKDEVMNTLGSNIRPPVQILETGKPVVAVASFVVDIKGNTKGFQILKTSSKDINSSIFEAFKKLDGEWSPAIFNGQPVDSEVFIVFDIKPMGVSSIIPKIPNSIVVQVLYYGVKRAPVVIGTSTMFGSFPRRR